MDADAIILRLPMAQPEALEQLVEDCLAAKVALFAAVGRDCQATEIAVDLIIAGEGPGEGRFMLTTSHPDETLDEVMEFARLYDEGRGVRVVDL